MMKRVFGTKCRGMTVVELVVTIGLLATAAAFAAPNIIEWLPNYRLNAAARDMVNHMNRAKSSALKNDCYGVITFDLDISGTTYDYVIYLDRNKDLQYDSSETILFLVNFNTDYSQSVSLASVPTFPNNGNGRPTLAFNRRGLTIVAGGGLASGTVDLINTNGKTKQITVSAVGGLRIS
ncbi:MAG: GspH/FimT family protein [Deltaproteobacteria bacterium]|nr:MAG: GspH/FimT family protein [Deltaproteobacteria bacterium]